MQKRFSISIIYIQPLDEIIIKDLHRNFSEIEYNDERGYGFKDVRLLDSTYLSATLLKRIPTFIPEYNPDSGELIKRKIFFYSNMLFAFDTKFNLLEIFGSSKNISKVRSVLRLIFPNNAQLSEVNLSPVKIIPILLKVSEYINIEQLTVRNFQYKENIIGCFEMRRIKSDFVMDIINKYGYDVIKAVISISTPDFNDISLSISNIGRLMIRCEEEQFDEIFSFLKSILFKKE